MGLGRVSEYPEGATWQPCEQQPPGTITLRTPVENFQILFFFFFFLIILPHTMNYKQNKNDNE